MSWSLYATGTKAGVLRKVREFKPTMDAEQAEAAKKLIEAEVEAGGEGVEVKANGSISTFGDKIQRHLSIHISTIEVLAE